MMVSRTTVKTCDKCGSSDVYQDNDILDTWFSAALWPFAALGWPNKTAEYEYFYPTDTLVTGYDIIFFWVVRMIFSALEYTGKVPFKNVLIHGLARDAQGRKMSKSLGNGVDPLEIIEKYGADALRFSLVIGNSPGNDMRFSEEKVSACRNFANKLWNAARFIHMNIDGFDAQNKLPDFLNLEDNWILSLLNSLTLSVTENLEKFELGIAAQKIYDFVWDYFCDWYIEFAKIRIQEETQSAENTRCVLVYVMDKILKLLHPFMPFVTEKIWQTLPCNGESIMIAEYPKFVKKLCNEKSEIDMRAIIDVIKAVRAQRAEMNVVPSKRTNLFIEAKNVDLFSKCELFLKKMAYAKEVEIKNNIEISEEVVTIVTADAKIFILMDELVDRQAELTRLKKELESTQKRFDQDLAKLKNETFLSKAPTEVVDGAKKNVQILREKLASLKNSIARLS